MVLGAVVQGHYSALSMGEHWAWYSMKRWSCGEDAGDGMWVNDEIIVSRRNRGPDADACVFCTRPPLMTR